MKKTTKQKRKATQRLKKKVSIPFWKNNQVRILLFVTLAATLLAYIPSLSNGFVNWDDPDYVLDNQLIFNWNLDNLIGIFTQEVSSNYHPFCMLSLAFDYAIDGANPLVFHIHNLVLHLLNCLLVFYFIFRYTKGNHILSFITAMIFGLHPMHVESVAWVTERKDLLYTLYFLLSMISYLYYYRKGNMKFFWLALIFGFCSFMSKPAAITLPLVLVLMDYVAGRKFNKKVILEKIPFFALAIVFGLLTYYIQSDTAVRDFDQIPLFKRFFFAGFAFCNYLFKFLLPINLSAIYTYPPESLMPVYYYFMPILGLAITGSVYYFYRKKPLVIFGFFFFLFTISITLQLVSFGAAIMSERYTYVPYIGLGLLAGLLYQYLSRRFSKQKQILATVGFLLLGTMGYLTWQQCKVWENDETLWTNAIKNNRWKSDHPYLLRAKYFRKQGRYAEAEKDMLEVMKINSDKDDNILSYANLLFETNRLKEALPYYNQLLEKNPNYVEALLSRGVTYARMGNPQAGLADLSRGLEIDPNSMSGYKNRGTLHFQIGDYRSALTDYLRYYQTRKGAHEIANAIASCYIKLGDFKNGLIYANYAISSAPNAGLYYYNRAVCNKGLGNKVTARQDAQKAQALGQKVEASFYNGL
jgi:tetratricopeptide (TPR) repeat protein